MSTHYNNVAQAVSGTPGTGTITLGAAITGAQSLGAAAGGNATVDVFITDGNAWEVARNCTYTHSGTSLTRGTLEASSTGAVLSLTSAAVVRVALSATSGNDLVRLMQMVTPGGRLTTESGVPVGTSDRTAQSTLHYTPFVHDGITLWDGSDWRPITFTERSIALSGLVSGRPYDVFGFLSAGSLSLELLAWTNGTTRATAVTLQDGRYCLSGDKTRLLLGTIYTTGTNTTADSAGGTTTQVGGQRFVSNVYNKVTRDLLVIDTANSWSYTSATIRKANNASGAGNSVEFVSALAEGVDAVAHGCVYLGNNSALSAKMGVGVDSTSAFSGVVQGGYSMSAVVFVPIFGAYRGRIAPGYHRINWLESGADGTSLFLGDMGTDGIQTGLYVTVYA